MVDLSQKNLIPKAVVAFISFFSLWTITSNIIVFAEGTLVHLMYSMPAILFGSIKLSKWLNEPNLNTPTEIDRKSAYFLLFIIISVSAITYFAHRPDGDDAHFVNMAIGAVHYQNLALLKFDTMHGIEGMPIHLQLYKFHSYELLIAALSRIFSLDVLLVYYSIMPVLLAAFSIFVFSHIYRNLLPNDWLLAVLLHVLVILALGQEHRSYGNFGYVRLFQGKSILVTIIIPLIWYNSIAWHSTKHLKSWVMLMLTQVIAVGFSANAIFVAPIAAIIPAIANSLVTNTTLKDKLHGIIYCGMSSLYPIMAGIALFLIDQKIPLSASASHSLIDDFRMVFGNIHYIALHLFIILFYWISETQNRKFYILTSVLVALLVINPLLYELISNTITQHHNWRLLWAIPVPLLATLFIIKAKQYRIFISVGLILLLISPNSSLSASNKTTFSSNPIKLDMNDYKIAQRIITMTHKEAVILAAQNISGIIPMSEDIRHPLVVAPIYLIHIKPFLQPEDWQLRTEAYNTIISPTTDLNALKLAISRYNIDLVAINSQTSNSNIAALMQSLNYTKIIYNGYELYCPSSSELCRDTL